MKKISKRFLGICLAGVMTLSGCSMEGPGGGNDKANKDNKDLKIGVSLSTTNNPFFVSIKKGIEEKAKDMGIDVKFVDAQNDAAKQGNDMDDLIQQQVDAIVVNPVDSAAISSSVQAANDADIPVVTLDRSSDKGKVASFVASDNIKGGEMAANFLVEKVGEKAKVAELEGIPGASATRERGKGFHNIADKKLDVIAKQSADFDRSKGLSVTENMLQGNKNIKAIFAQNDEMALGAVEACNSANRKDIIIIGFDGNDDAKKAVKEGKMAATIAQQPKVMGEKAFVAAVNAAKGKKVKKEIKVDLELIKHE